MRVLTVRDDVLVIDPATATGPFDLGQFPEQPRIRRWDGDGMFAASGGVWRALEQGVQVRFANGTYKVGDYWTIPARTNSGDVEWPRNTAGTPDFVAPEGIDHHFARLALVHINGSGDIKVDDCRKVFSATDRSDAARLCRWGWAGGHARSDGAEQWRRSSRPAAGGGVAAGAIRWRAHRSSLT